MTDEEKKQLVDAVITQLKSEGTDVSNANIVSNANGIDYVVAYGKNGQIVRAIPTAISNEKVGASGYMNSYTDAGVYTINTIGGENLPIDNQGAISARLTVLVTESGGNKVITQVLNLNNNVGGEGNVYIRSCQNGEWKAWGKLQTNVEVGQINTLDHLTDNGIYSGVFTDGTPTSVGTFYDTFVLIVINNYAVSIPTGNPQSISQLKYSLGLDGSISVASRKRDQYGYWDNWTSLDEKSLVEEEKTRAKKAEKAIESNAMQYNTLGVNVYADKAEIYGRSIDGKPRTMDFPAATTEKAGVMSAEDKKALNAVPNKIESAIAEESKETDEKIATEIDKIKDGDTIVGQAREIHSRNGKTVPDSFLARTTAGSGTIGDGVASLKSVGGGIVKNLVDGTFTTKQYYDNAVIDGKIYKREVASAAYPQLYYKDASVPKVVGHKYYFAAKVIYNGVSCTISVNSETNTNRYTDVEKWQNVSIIGSAEENKDIFIRANNATYIWVIKPLLIDLTEMFGAGNEPTKEECDRLFGTMDALPQGLTIANPATFTSTGFNQFNPENVLDGKAIVDNAIVPGDKKIAVIPCLPCKVGTGENNGYCIHGEFGDDINVYLTPLNPMEVEGELYMHELTKDATTDTYVPQIKGYMLVEVPTTANLCAHFLWSEDKCKRDTYEPYFESKVELPTIPQMSEWGLAGIQTNGTLVCDEIDFVKGVYRKKIGVVDLGTLTWNYYNNKYFYSNNPHRCKTGGSAICDRYSTYGIGTLDFDIPNKNIIISSSLGVVIANDTTYTDAKSFKAALQGVMLYYELAKPEEYPLPKVDNNYISSDYGVEQFDSVVPCSANNLYYMRSLAGETRNFLDRMYDNTTKTDAKEVADYITNGIEGNKELATNAPNLALRALFVAAGAEYNDSGVDKTKTTPWGETVTHKAGHYYLNGLGDITEPQMMDIYNAPHNALYEQGYIQQRSIRTAIFRGSTSSLGFSSNINALFMGCENIEVVGNNELFLYFADTGNTVSRLFRNCYKLRVINLRVMYVSGITFDQHCFSNCQSLEFVKIERLHFSLSLADCSRISKNSIIHMIQYATPTTAITITLHPDAYARLAEDADIVAALAAQPLITLVSA